jgi:hypothetical protein
VDKAGGAAPGLWVKEESSSFLKKRTKKLLNIKKVAQTARPADRN